MALKDRDNPQGDLPGRIRSMAKNLDGRLQRFAATENARAWNDEHLEATDTLSNDYSDLAKKLGNIWDATLDADTCEICADHDGDVIQIGTDFDDDDEPGDVHPYCRCMAMAIVIDPGISDEDDEQPDRINVEEDMEAA